MSVVRYSENLKDYVEDLLHIECIGYGYQGHWGEGLLLELIIVN